MIYYKINHLNDVRLFRRKDMENKFISFLRKRSIPIFFVVFVILSSLALIYSNKVKNKQTKTDNAIVSSNKEEKIFDEEKISTNFNNINRYNEDKKEQFTTSQSSLESNINEKKKTKNLSVKTDQANEKITKSKKKDEEEITKKNILKQDNKIKANIINEKPTDTINKLHNGLKKFHEQKFDNYILMQDLVNKTYNIEKMISMIIGSKWRSINKNKQEEISLVFGEYVVRNYIKRFKKINNVSFENIGSKELKKNFFLVQTKLKIIDDDDVKIDYLLSKKDKSWKIFDILLAGSVSEIATKKSEFSSFISNENIDELINALKRQNAKLKNKD